MTLFSLNRVIVKNEESNITLNWMSLNDEREIQHSVLPGLVGQYYFWNCSCFGS